MYYPENEAKKGFVAVLIVASVVLLLSLILSSMIEFDNYDYYSSTATSISK